MGIELKEGSTLSVQLEAYDISSRPREANKPQDTRIVDGKGRTSDPATQVLFSRPRLLSEASMTS